MVLLFKLLLVICSKGAIAAAIDYGTTNGGRVEPKFEMSYPLSGAVRDNSNLNAFIMSETFESITKMKSFSDRKELMGELDKYCQYPENYDTTEYGPIEDWDVSQITSMYNLFVPEHYYYDYVTSCNPDISKWDVSNVESFKYMFLYSSSFNQYIGNWNVSSCTDFHGMFTGAKAFNQDIGNWNVSSGTNFKAMFLESDSFNQDIGNWNVSSAINFHGMFARSKVFNQDIGNWDVSSGTNFDYMFTLSSFNQDIGYWNVSSGITFRHMFSGATSFKQNLKRWLPWINSPDTNSENWCSGGAICDASLPCVDDKNFTQNGKVTRTCWWLRKLEKRRQNQCFKDNKVRAACPKTCGTCCADDDTFMLKLPSGAEKNCYWIGQKLTRKSKYCDPATGKKVVRERCSMTCSTCFAKYLCLDRKYYQGSDGITCKQIGRKESRRVKYCSESEGNFPVTCGRCCDDNPDFLTKVTSKGVETKKVVNGLQKKHRESTNTALTVMSTEIAHQRPRAMHAKPSYDGNKYYYGVNIKYFHLQLLNINPFST